VDSSQKLLFLSVEATKSTLHLVALGKITHMMKKLFKNTVFAITALCCNIAYSQVEDLVSINPATGVHTIIDSIPNVKWVTTSPNYTTFDHINNRYIFRGADAAMNWALYSIDVNTGNVISNPSFPVLADPADNIIGLQFDNSTGSLYGLHWDASTQTEFLVSVNPTTGAHTLISSIPNVMWISTSPNYITFDHINGRYIFRGADAAMNWALYSIDVNTGNVISNPSFPVLADPADNIIELQFDNSTGSLYGLHWDASTLTEYLVSVNPTTGAHTLIGSIPNVMWISASPHYTTFDHINGRYIFRGVDAAINWALYSIDVNTGNVISNPSFPVLADPADNIIELQFDSSTGSLYGLHWDANLTLGVNDLHLNGNYKIYPNPFQEKTTIEFNEIHDNITLNIFNSEGKLVRSIDKKNTQEIELYKNELNAGIYYINISTENTNTVKKVIIK
jgi:hypothetical protein